jgi:hypothetical protein
MPTFKLNNLITFFPHAAACGHEMKISKLTSRHSTNNIAFLVSGPLFILREDIASLSVSRCTNTVYVHTQFSHDRAHGRLVVSDFSHIPFHFFSPQILADNFRSQSQSVPSCMLGARVFWFSVTSSSIKRSSWDRQNINENVAGEAAALREASSRISDLLVDFWLVVRCVRRSCTGDLMAWDLPSLRPCSIFVCVLGIFPCPL